MKYEVIDINGTPFKYDLPQNRQLKLEDTFAQKNPIGYFILSSKDGDIFNPLCDDIGLLKIKDKKRGKRLYNLNNCSCGCYKAYITFLRSKNRTHFIIAQRRFSNGI